MIQPERAPRPLRNHALDLHVGDQVVALRAVGHLAIARQESDNGQVLCGDARVYRGHYHRSRAVQITWVFLPADTDDDGLSDIVDVEQVGAERKRRLEAWPLHTVRDRRWRIHVAGNSPPAPLQRLHVKDVTVEVPPELCERFVETSRVHNRVWDAAQEDAREVQASVLADEQCRTPKIGNGLRTQWPAP